MTDLEAKGNVKQETKKEIEQRIKLHTDQLTYINHYPILWKYISLFP